MSHLSADIDRDALVFASRWPCFPLQMGAPIRTNRLVTGLARHFDTTYVTFQHHPGTPELHLAHEALEAALPGIRVVTVPYPQRPAKRTAQVRSLLSRDSWEWGRYKVPAFKAALESIAAERRAALVHFDDVGVLASAPAGPGLSAYCAHDVAHRVSRSTAEVASGPRATFAEVEWRKVQREELRGWRAVDLCVAASPLDVERMRAAGAARAELCPNGTDDAERLPLPPRAPGAPLRIVFVGNGAYQPYARGLAWFVSEVLPLIQKRHPAQFRVVGRPPQRPVEAPGVEYLGLVDEVGPHYGWADLVVVPVFEGSGTRLKILEAMALGRPVVSTSLGAEGLPLQPDRHYRRADDPETFAAAVLATGHALERPAGLEPMLAEAREAIAPLFWPAIADRLASRYRDAIDAARADHPTAATPAHAA